MKEMLRAKYCPMHHDKKLHNQLHTLKQGNLHVIEGLNTFEDIISRIECIDND